MNFKLKEKRFRAFDQITKKMVFTGFDILGETTLFDLCKQYQIAHNVNLVISEYTGAKAGTKDIYEGDILSLPQSQNKPVYEVVWGGFEWMVRSRKVFNNSLGTLLSVSKSLDYEIHIIGNIYENPQLLD